VTPRERVFAALDHKEPDRIPLDMGGITATVNIEVYRDLLQDLRLSEEIFCLDQGIVCPSEAVLERFQIDTRYIYPTITRANSNPPPQRTDAWGVKRKLIGQYYEITPDGHPLAQVKDPDELRDFRWPTAEEVVGGPTVLEAMIRQGEMLAQRDYAVVLEHGLIQCPFEYSLFMRGYQTFFVDLHARPKIALAIMERITEIAVNIIQEYVRPLSDYLDVVMIGDDLGTQNGPMISPLTYRNYIKPMHRRIIESLRSSTRAKVIFHTDGTASPFIDDLAEMGVAGINPVQISAEGMSSKELKERFGDKVAFWGAIDGQNVLPFGTRHDVENEVRRRITDLGRGGGYVLTSVQAVQPPTPPRNVIAMFDEAIRYGSTFYSRKPD